MSDETWLTGTFTAIGDGTGDDPRRPDLPPGVTIFRMVEDHGSVMAVEYQP